MEPQPKLPSIVTRVALIINLSPSDAIGSKVEKSQVFANQVGNLGLPATWVIDDLRQAKCLAEGLLATTAQELALTASARSPQRLRSELSSRQAALLAETGHRVSIISGDPQQLRARAALLADLGIQAVVSNSLVTETAKPPRLLPCGLWQIDPAIMLPQTRRRWSLLPSRPVTAAQLLTIGMSSQPIIVVINANRLSDRDSQGSKRMLQDIAEAMAQQQLAVVTVSDVVAQLVSEHEVKPQRSILRRAA